MEQRKEEIKVGSKVTIANRYGKMLGTVTGETPKCWRVGNDLFYKHNLYLRTSDRWSTTQIWLTKQSDIDEIERRDIISMLQGTSFNSIPLATLRQIKELLAKGEK